MTISYAVRCDFCCALPTVEIYECPVVTAHLPRGPHTFNGPWHACQTCNLLIIAEAWSHLVARITREYLDSGLELPTRKAFDIAWGTVDAFRRGREALASIHEL